MPLNNSIARSLFLLILLLSLTCTSAFADDDDWYYGGSGVQPVDNSEYLQECGACHFAYQPGLLPSRSWEKLMADLENHFGEDASLDEATSLRLTEYMVKYAAEHSDYRRSRSIAKSLGPNEVPTRITKLRYFRADHKDDSLMRIINRNDRIKGLSNCSTCHATAAKGNYSERGIDIPGYGRWDD